MIDHHKDKMDLSAVFLYITGDKGHALHLLQIFRNFQCLMTQISSGDRKNTQMQNKKEKNHLVEVIYFLSNKVICLHLALYLLTCCFSLGEKEKQ